MQLVDGVRRQRGVGGRALRFRRYHLIAHSIDVALQRRAVRRLIPAVVLACIVLATTCLVAFIVQGANDHRALNGARKTTARTERLAERLTTALNTENATHRIQARGLQANCHLVRAMGDIGQLLTFRSSQAVPPIVLGLLVDLKTQSTTYATLERQIRAC